MKNNQLSLQYPPLWSERHAQSQAISNGLSVQEYKEFQERLGRIPTREEIAVVGAMWSEHCSYKSSKAHLRRLPGTGDDVLTDGAGNAGCIALGGGLVAALKMESHNHPSFIEPVQGAATGVGGIVRDILAMGARPIATMNSLKFGPLQDPEMKRRLEGVVEGIASYGNALGVPTVGGELGVLPCYQGNILVNVMALGVMKQEQMRHAAARRVGDLVLYVGAATGVDGIHGATMASASFDDTGAKTQSMHHVQVGDPFYGKLLIEACLEMFETPWVSAVQDMGAAGLTSSLVELARSGERGIRLDIREVPKRFEDMTAYQCLLSESQERMVLVIDPEGLEALMAIATKWGLESAVVGVVMQEEHFEVIGLQGRPVCQIPIDLLGGPRQLERPLEAPQSEPVLHDMALPTPTQNELDSLVAKVLAHPRVASKRALYEQFDAGVGLRHIPGDFSAAVCRLVGWDASMMVALCVDAQPLVAHKDPYTCAMHAVAESARNLACCGAKPLALTDCLNLGDPTLPLTMWQLSQTVDGIAQAAQVFGTPVISGNVSLYNASGDHQIHPTATIGMIGLFPPEVSSPTPAGWVQAMDEVWLLGDVDSDSMQGSTTLEVMDEGLSRHAAPLDLALAGRCNQVLLKATQQGMLQSAHDVSDGGVVVTLVESTLWSEGLGVHLHHRASSPWWWFSQAAPRVVVSLSPDQVPAWRQLCDDYGVPCLPLGRVVKEPCLTFESLDWVLKAKVCREAYQSAFV